MGTGGRIRNNGTGSEKEEDRVESGTLYGSQTWIPVTNLGSVLTYTYTHFTHTHTHAHTRTHTHTHNPLSTLQRGGRWVTPPQREGEPSLVHSL